MAQAKLISEMALYTLVMRAQKANPKAAEFQAWVTDTVLPAIRQDGMYVQGEEKLDPNHEADIKRLKEGCAYLRGLMV